MIKLYHILEFFQSVDGLKQFQKGENSFESQHVCSLSYDSEILLIKGSVLASQRDKLYDVQIDINADRTIKGGLCSCPAGLGRCHHMAALLIHAHHNISKTDKSCQWKRQKAATDDTCVPIDQLFANPEQQDYRAFGKVLPQAVKDQLYKDVTSEYGLHPGVSFLLMQEIPDDALTVHSLEAIFTQDGFLQSSDKAQFLQEHAKVSAEVVKTVEQLTIGQRANPNWLLARRFVLTASNFFAILRAIRLNRFPPSLFKTLLGSYDLDGVLAVQWGKNHEEQVKKIFEQCFKIQVKPCGLFLHESGLLGASPDGLIGHDSLLEIKCPYKWKGDDLEEVLKKESNYIVRIKNDVLEVNKDHCYYDQIQGQLHITKRQHCNLVIWTTKSIVHVSIDKDESWAANISMLLNFYYNIFLPAILSHGKVGE